VQTPLVLLHGLGTGPGGWAPQVDALSATRRVVAPSLIPFSFERACSVVDELGLERFDLCGLSLGALVALRYAGERPERVRRLAVCAGFMRLPPHLGAVQLVLATLVRVLPAKTVRRGLTSDVPVAYREELDLEPAEVAAIMRAGAAFRLTRVPGAPTLVLCGERDRVNRRLSRRLAEALPDGGFALVPEAGHVANLDNSAAFTALLRRFLDD
jgi:3-oxoadipate enol-lactonase